MKFRSHAFVLAVFLVALLANPAAAATGDRAVFGNHPFLGSPNQELG